MSNHKNRSKKNQNHAQINKNRSFAGTLLSVWSAFEKENEQFQALCNDLDDEINEADEDAIIERFSNADVRLKIQINRLLDKDNHSIQRIFRYIEELAEKKNLDPYTVEKIQMKTTDTIWNSSLSQNESSHHYRFSLIGVPLTGYLERMSKLGTDMTFLFRQSKMVIENSDVLVLGATEIEKALLLTQDVVAVKKFYQTVLDFGSTRNPKVLQNHPLTKYIQMGDFDEKELGTRVLVVAVLSFDDNEDVSIPAYDLDYLQDPEALIDSWQESTQALKNQDEEIKMLLEGIYPQPLLNATFEAISNQISLFQIDLSHKIERNALTGVVPESIGQIVVCDEDDVVITTVFEDKSIHRYSMGELPAYILNEVVNRMGISFIEKSEEVEWLKSLQSQNNKQLVISHHPTTKSRTLH